jgi:5-methylthioadenosine/S-adenosylhomocysteine deaminase
VKSRRGLCWSRGRVWDPGGDIDLPRVRDIVIERGTITSVSETQEQSHIKQALAADAMRGRADVIDARGKLVMPGFINAHYHSYDTLAKGLIEDAPFDVWALHSQPAYFGKRSKSELRVRTMLGAIECLKNGITTVQDMCTLVPHDEETLDVIAAAYREVGIRVVFSIALRDIAELDIAPFLPTGMSAAARALVSGHPRDPLTDLEFVERQLVRYRPLPPRWHWALSASGPQRASQSLLERLADLSTRHGLPIFTHVYETKAQTAKARMRYTAHDGSIIRYLAEVGLLKPGTNLAHGVWLTPSEIDLIAQHGAGVVLNPMSNMKLKSGVAPIQRLQAAGVNLALGCDNCSCGDCQSMFQAMKLYCLLATVSDPNPTGVHARHAVQAATLGGARAVGLGD